MTHPFERLLLATEHTEFDSGAEHVALTMAGRCGLPLEAVLPVVSNPEFEIVAPELAVKAERAAAAKMAEMRAAAVTAGVQLEVRARRGEDPWREIVDEAVERKADLLITRRRGKRGFLANLLVGEMVSKVAGHAPCSTLMVPRAGTMWSRRILAAIDGSPASERVAAVASAVAAQCGLPLALVCVAGDDGAASRARAESSLARAAQLVQGVELHSHVLVGKPFEQILAEALRSGADLIVVGRRGETGLDRLMLGGTSQKVIGLAEGPVLVVAA